MRVVKLSGRPKDDGVIDWIWVRNALAGSASCAAELTRRELIAAVHLGIAAHKTCLDIADLLLIHPRQVDRFRLEPWPTENLTEPAEAAATPPAPVEPLRTPDVWEQLELDLIAA